jgi:phenylacetaldehyde dehydrogenase
VGSIRTPRWARLSPPSSSSVRAATSSPGDATGSGRLRGGRQVGRPGYFVAPTGLDGAGPGNKVYDEEIFGPVVTAMPFKDTADVAPAANETVYGLAAGIWTNGLQEETWQPQ